MFLLVCQAHTPTSYASRIRMIHVSRTTESFHSIKWVMSFIQMSHVTHWNESYLMFLLAFQAHTHQWVMPHTHTNESCRTHTPMSHASHIWMIYVSCTNESCHSFQWLAPHCNSSVPSTHTPTSHASHMRTGHVTHTNESCHSFKRSNESNMVFLQVFRAHTHQWVMPPTYTWVMSYTQMSHVTHSNEQTSHTWCSLKFSEHSRHASPAYSF